MTDMEVFHGIDPAEIRKAGPVGFPECFVEIAEDPSALILEIDEGMFIQLNRWDAESLGSILISMARLLPEPVEEPEGATE